MIDYIKDIVNKLLEIINKPDMDWDEFDAVLNSIDDINAYDEEYGIDILSTLLGSIIRKKFLATDIVKHFMDCGYDVTANNGVNGGDTLSVLCAVIGLYNYNIIDTVKMLMNAGAPVVYRKWDDDPDEDPKSLIESLESWSYYHYINITCYEIAKANLEGKDYNSIDCHLTCIGKTLTSVSIANNKNGQALKSDRSITVYTEPLILWFDDKPLVVDRYSRLVVNPVYVEDNKDQLEDITPKFDTLVGASLKEVRFLKGHFDEGFCCLDFNNGKRLVIVSYYIDYGEKIGAFDIVESENDVDIEKLNVRHIYAHNSINHHPLTTVYSEKILVLICDSGSYVLKTDPVKDDISGFEIVPINKDLLDDYAREYPIKSPSKPKCMYNDGVLNAMRFDSNDGYLYIAAGKYDFEVQLSDKLYDHLGCDRSNGSYFSQDEGIHIDFRKNKNGLFRLDVDFLGYVKDGKVLEIFVSEDGFWKINDRPYDLTFWESLYPISEEEMLSITNGSKPKLLENKV